MKFFSKLIGVAFAVILALSASAAAYCGLQSCPRIDPHAGSHAFEAGLRARVVEFDIADESGFYGVLSPRFFARARGALGIVGLGVEVPFVTLHTDNVGTSGIGNPVLMAQYARRISHAWSGEMGLQWELPLGDTEHGLADDHMMVLPWIGARTEWGSSFVSGMLGYSETLDGGGDSHAASARLAPLAKAAHNGVDHDIPGEPPVFVNPHGDREAHWRAGAGLRKNHWTFETFGLGQADFSEPNTVFYTRLGVSAEWALNSSIALQAVADAPVTGARRSEAALGMDVKVGW